MASAPTSLDMGKDTPGGILTRLAVLTEVGLSLMQLGGAGPGMGGHKVPGMDKARDEGRERRAAGSRPGELGSWSGGLGGVSGLDFPGMPGPMPGGGSVEPLWAPGGGVGGECGSDRIATHLLILVMVVSITLSPNAVLPKPYFHLADLAQS